MFVSVRSPVVYCMYTIAFKSFFIFCYCIAFLPAMVAANWYSVFMLPVSLCKWKILNVQTILTIMFKNVLRTFEADILKIFKNIQHRISSKT